ncbi:GxxExxY protein [Natronospira bacteriovora]|uniref:GxxExxY protein n=1 Tax=Natronospira bacteriovora TaxID=3069753 RepID=A0ABU0W8R4_9GAMM|nr:GxxExxY protein [Natronospira sp. AB-CW4]MDQ2070138.1 GxxExxY protein [Natronospira sp. AB-CW4]
MDENAIGTQVIGASIRVHEGLGPGLMESVYETALAFELEEAGLSVKRQVPVPIVYRGIELEQAFRADLIVNDKVLLELKSVETITLTHRKQVQTYINLMGYRLGYLLNFGAPVLKRGIVRCVNRLPEPGVTATD